MCPIKQLFLVSFLLIILALPINIYVIGDAIGAGLQSPLFRYQQTYLGTSVITLADDLGYVTSGIITGRSALSILLWALGTILLITAAGYLVYSRDEATTAIRKPLALLVASGALAYLLSCIAQYGPLLHGPAGFSVPVGVPLILAVAVYILKAEDDDESGYEGEEEEYGEEMEEEQ